MYSWVSWKTMGRIFQLFWLDWLAFWVEALVIITITTLMTAFFLAGADALDEEVAQAGSKGFIGCFSSVQYNHVAPLKAALLNRGSSLVSIRGHLLESNCGALADLSTSKSRLGIA